MNPFVDEKQTCRGQDEASEGLLGHNLSSSARRRSTSSRHAIYQTVILFLVVLLGVQHLYLTITASSGWNGESTHTGMGRFYQERRVLHATNRFFSSNDTEMDAAWESIDTGHGVVGLSRDEVPIDDIPMGMDHPRDSSKQVYNLAAYHDLHCVQYLRRHYRAMVRGEDITWPLGHDMHCFDALRQSIMCHADDTLLFSGGYREVGKGQTRQCRSWDRLRDWATQHSACYKDYEFPSAVTRWGTCDDGDDGLPHGSLLD